MRSSTGGILEITLLQSFNIKHTEVAKAAITKTTGRHCNIPTFVILYNVECITESIFVAYYKNQK